MLRIYILSFILLLSSCSSDEQEQGLANEDLESTEEDDGTDQEEGDTQNSDNYEQGNDNYNQQNSNSQYSNSNQYSDNSNQYSDNSNQYSDNSNQYSDNESSENLGNQNFNEATEGNYQGENNQLFGNTYNQNGYNQNSQEGYNQNNQSNEQSENAQEIENSESEVEDEETPTISPLGDPNEFSGSPSTPNSLRVMAEGEAPEEYVVEFGDTLFDICSQLLGEGGYWPKLWSLNNYIKNPHFIWPGMRLRFYPGDEEDPPFIEIVQEDEVVPIVDEEDVDMKALVKETVVPENGTLSMQETEVIGKDDIEEAPDLFETIGTPYNSDQVSVTLPGFIFSEENQASCMVLGGTLGEALVGQDRLFICDPNEDLNIGSSYTALRYTGAVENVESGSFVGHQYQFVAHVKMTRELDDGKKYIGIVTNSRLGLREGDIVIPYLSTRRRLSLNRNFENPTVADAAAHIVGFDLQGQQIGGEGSLVFLDRGSVDGVSKGQLMKIDQSLQYFLLTYDLEEPTLDTVSVGFVRIIDTTEVASIGYIVYNEHEVFIGDMVGKG